MEEEWNSDKLLPIASVTMELLLSSRHLTLLILSLFSAKQEVNRRL